MKTSVPGPESVPQEREPSEKELEELKHFETDRELDEEDDFDDEED